MSQLVGRSHCPFLQPQKIQTTKKNTKINQVNAIRHIRYLFIVLSPDIEDDPSHDLLRVVRH